jgi:hypothetical protein
MGNLPGKSPQTVSYPLRCSQPSGLLTRVEPLLTPQQLRNRYLKEALPFLQKLGINYTDDDLKDRIQMATAEAELELKTPIFAEEFFERLAFDRNTYNAWVYLKSENRPIQTIISLKIESSNFERIYEIDPSWLEMGNAYKGQINVVPLLAAYSAGGSMTAYANGAAAYLLIAANVAWVPAYWSVRFTAGLSGTTGTVPIVVNNLIGTMATIQILSGAALANPYNSVSLGQDGISQGQSSAGVQVFAGRIQELMLSKETLLGQIKRAFNTKMFITNI